MTVTLVGSLTLFGGLAAANALPRGVQSVAADVLDDVGVSVPSPNPAAGDHPNVRGQSGGNAVDPASHGGAVSSTAHANTATGGDHGAAVSSEASDGKSHAGEQSPTAATVPSTDPNGKPDTTGKPDKTKDANGSSGADDSLNFPNNEP